MSRWTGTDYVELLKASCGNPASDELSETQILQYLNDEYINHLAFDYNHAELDGTFNVTLVDGTAEYTESTTTDIGRITHARDATNGQMIREITRSEYETLKGNSTSEGTVQYYFRSGLSSGNQQFTFYPTPGAAATVTFSYQKRPTEIVQSPTATSSVLAEPWDSILFDRAEVRCLRHLKIIDAAVAVKALSEIRQREREVYRKTAPRNYVRAKIRSKLGEVLK